MPGLGARLGRGGATTTLQSLVDSDCIVIMGSNMAENHPVGFRFVTQARERGARVLHIDPRFSRTSAMADMHVAIRAGSDLAFLGGLINYVLEHDRWFHDYVRHYTNAANIVTEDYRDSEDLGGLFSGWVAEEQRYDARSWQYASQAREPAPDPHPAQTAEPRTHYIGDLSSLPLTDPTLEHPRSVFQIMRRHFARYTPELVERVCGVPQGVFREVAETICDNSNRERTTSFCYAVAWTQHTTGTQIIGACAILQLLLGNIGRPGGGILALRGHATIQGSTDIPTLYNLLPGYISMPTASDEHATLEGFLAEEWPLTGAWHELPNYLVSLLKAWYGDAATGDTEFGWHWLPKIDGDYSFQNMLLLMRDGVMKGLFCMGMNPAVGGQNARLARRALATLDWLVVRDIHEIETAAFWHDAPEVRSGEVSPSEIGTEVFFIPAAVAAEKDGSFTNTQRLVQWHDKAVEPPGDARSEAWFVDRLARRLRELYAAEDTPQAHQLAALEWDYPLAGAHLEPDLGAVLREINGFRIADGAHVAGFDELRDDGSTACGCWIYSGVMPAPERNLARNRAPDGHAALDWGFAWPANRRILYNRASADPSGKPWSERKRWVWWDDASDRWTGFDIPDFPETKPPDYQPSLGARGMAAHPGDAPFVNMADGRGWLFAASGLKDGPLPAHYEPWETPVGNLLYPAVPRNPATSTFERADNPYHAIADERFPHVLTTWRLTEHLTAGGMSRWVPWLAELQPHVFVEISPELACEIGVANGDWVTIETARAAIDAPALVTERVQPLMIAGRRVHQVGMPWHFGFGGEATGASANELVALVEDPNSLIHEAKSLTCRVRRRESAR